jgi:hypothetical protein
MRARLYTRELPGGGYVAIDVLPAGAGSPAHLRLWVERRADPSRRGGHNPPIVVELDALDSEAARAELERIASDNVAIAQAIRRWQRDHAGPRR